MVPDMYKPSNFTGKPELLTEHSGIMSSIETRRVIGVMADRATVVATNKASSV